MVENQRAVYTLITFPMRYIKSLSLEDYAVTIGSKPAITTGWICHRRS